MKVTKREKKFKGKIKQRWENGTLSKEQLSNIPFDKADEYLTRELKNKYKLQKVSFSCRHCALIALYQDNGYITDEELIADTGLKHK